MKPAWWQALVIRVREAVAFMRCAASIVFSLVLPTFLLGADVGAVFEPVRQKSHVETVRISHSEYTINVGGTVDMDNTSTPYGQNTEPNSKYWL